MESLKEKNLRYAFKRVKEDNLFLLQKIENLEERVETQEKMLKESFELLREQIEIYRAEASISKMNEIIPNNKSNIKSNTSKNKDKSKEEELAKVKKHDDLTKIEGIGPVIKRILESNEIFTFKDLSNTTENKLEKILVKNNLKQYSPQSWPKQAELAHFKMWEELREFQKELKNKNKK